MATLSSSFANKKQLQVTIVLGTGTFGSSNANTVTLNGFRCTVDVDMGGGSVFAYLNCKIFGVDQNIMNAAMTVQYNPQSIIKNTITVTAIDGDSQSNTVFQGDIIQALENFDSLPDACLEIQAQAVYFTGALTPVSPTSLKGPVNVAAIFAQLAQTMGLAFENNGVSTRLTNPVLTGTALDQAKELRDAARCNMYIDPTSKTLAITPLNNPRGSQKVVPLISPQSGLYGYPFWDGVILRFKSLYNPQIQFGGQVEVQTSLPPAANGTWYVSNVGYQLSSEMPGGPWYCTIEALKIQLVGS